MAFTPNRVGELRRLQEHDIYGQAVLGDPVKCAFAVVNAKRKSLKTSVRADSSASRGNADEVTTDLGCILVPSYQSIEIGDHFSFDEDEYVVVSKHVRRSVTGKIDHYECDIEVVPR